MKKLSSSQLYMDRKLTARKMLKQTKFLIFVFQMLIKSQLNYSCTKTSTKPRRDILHFGPLEGVAKGKGVEEGEGGRKEGRKGSIKSRILTRFKQTCLNLMYNIENTSRGTSLKLDPLGFPCSGLYVLCTSNS